MYHNVEHKNFTSPGAANLAQLTPCHMTPVAKEAAPSENSESRFVNGPGSVNKNLYYDLQIEIMSLNKHSLENCGDLLSRAKSPISVWTGSITLCANGSDFSWAGVVAKHRTGAKPGPRLLPKVKSQVSELVREEIRPTGIRYCACVRRLFKFKAAVFEPDRGSNGLCLPSAFHSLGIIRQHLDPQVGRYNALLVQQGQCSDYKLWSYPRFVPPVTVYRSIWDSRRADHPATGWGHYQAFSFASLFLNYWHS